MCKKVIRRNCYTYTRKKRKEESKVNNNNNNNNNNTRKIELNTVKKSFAVSRSVVNHDEIVRLF